MNIKALKESIEGVDIYIIDQILKDRYPIGSKILDAGCGSSRNLKWFYNSGFQTYGIDINLEDIQYCKELYKLQNENFSVASVDQMSFESNTFNHVICNAVLHFAKDLSHFTQMLNELMRILKPQGSLFIRTASNFGIEDQVKVLENGIYKLPDGSTRFLLTTNILQDIINRECVLMIEDVKTTIVEKKRSMTTLVIEKRG
ncbi:bifunctional 2-polyprenyl-6-hydroxyphenol methylase/3-demethylubiquinol 3-O-methyltransferase UbiG [uncultured Lutibacter sp.]|uniref:class I SAM-dependent methyltransferase n=1 Tax=uncultured Lutibacter sp. TaxID=437739 RepID=UPI0026281AFB|nr:class I SAM-dependent methyltransferase [uncultured Lutibacter sp.]